MIIDLLRFSAFLENLIDFYLLHTQLFGETRWITEVQCLKLIHGYIGNKTGVRIMAWEKFFDCFIKIYALLCQIRRK